LGFCRAGCIFLPFSFLILIKLFSLGSCPRGTFSRRGGVPLLFLIETFYGKKRSRPSPPPPPSPCLFVFVISRGVRFPPVLIKVCMLAIPFPLFCGPLFFHPPPHVLSKKGGGLWEIPSHPIFFGALWWTLLLPPPGLFSIFPIVSGEGLDMKTARFSIRFSMLGSRINPSLYLPLIFFGFLFSFHYHSWCRAMIA